MIVNTPDSCYKNLANQNSRLMALCLRFALLPARMMSERGGFNSKFSTWRLAVAYAHVFRLT